MPIITFPARFTKASSDEQHAADQARYLSTTTGDIQVYQLFAVWEMMVRANVSTTAALTQAASNTTAANASLSQFTGAPQTVTDLQSGLQNLLTAAGNFKAAATSWITANLTASDLLAFSTSTVNGVSSDVLTFTTFIPSAKIAPLRSDPTLAALVSAFDAIGATA
jgi:hypothetical protein